MRLQLKLRPGQAKELELQAGELVRLEGARGWQLTTIEGNLLVSAHGDAEDHEVGVHQRYAIASDKLVLVEAAGRCRMRLARCALPGTFSRYVGACAGFDAMEKVEAVLLKLRCRLSL